ncbi:MAG: hypothetical protein RML36_15360 [Anaerolineae bacterium]|nr:hypothetical protein [Anaerolineae bacterium]
MPTGVYNSFKRDLMLAVHHLVNHTIRCALMGSGHTFNPAHVNWSEVQSNEASGSGYTAGGQALANKSVTKDDANNRASFTANNVVWDNVTITFYHAVLYNDSATNKPLIGSFDFGGPVTVSNGRATIVWDTQGILVIT